MKDFILALIIIIFMFFAYKCAKASEIDWESLKRIVPEGECAGCTIPEMKKSVWYCK